MSNSREMQHSTASFGSSFVENCLAKNEFSDSYRFIVAVFARTRDVIRTTALTPEPIAKPSVASGQLVKQPKFSILIRDRAMPRLNERIRLE